MENCALKNRDVSLFALERKREMEIQYIYKYICICIIDK